MWPCANELARLAHQRREPVSAATAVALRAEMLVRLEEAGALTATGLDLSARPKMSFEQYRALGVLLGRATAAIRWAVGDWIAFGEERFGELAAEASEALGISPEGRMELVRVARAIPRHRRRASLSWTHHRAVARRSITPAQREELLDRAERDGWNARAMEAAARELCDRLPLPGKVRTDCDAILDELLAKGHRELVACGYDAEIKLELIVRAPGIEYVIERGAP